MYILIYTICMFYVKNKYLIFDFDLPRFKKTLRLKSTKAVLKNANINALDI